MATQTQRPWRTVVRTVFQAVIALLTLVPLVATNVYHDAATAPAAVAQVLAVCAALTRIMAMPQVEAFLQSSGILAWLAADPSVPPASNDSDVDTPAPVAQVVPSPTPVVPAPAPTPPADSTPSTDEQNPPTA